MLRILLVTLSLLFGATAAFAKPNFVVIFTDDQNDTGSLEYMPKLHDLIAERGITFENSFVNFPRCAPSRASLLTGQAAHNHGVRHNGTGWTTFKQHEENALPVWLQDAGYNTALLGKYINGYGKESKSTDFYNMIKHWMGADQSAPTVPPGWNLWYAGVKERYYDHSINENGTLLEFGTAPNDYSTDVLRDRAVRFIKDQAEAAKPFFMLIATKAPHGQGAEGVKGPAIASPSHQHDLMDVNLPAPPTGSGQDAGNPLENSKSKNQNWKRGDENAYRAALQSLQSVDDLLEAVVEELRATGGLDNTFIIYTSDNGFIYQSKGREGKNRPYDGAIKVPLLMRGPRIPENATRSQLVNNLDVVATILDLAGAKPGVALDGRSLVPLFSDANAPWRNAILVQFGSGGGVRTASRKYVKSDKKGFEALYDLSADPQEVDNKIAIPSYASDLAMLRQAYDSLKSCVGPSCW